MDANGSDSSGAIRPNPTGSSGPFRGFVRMVPTAFVLAILGGTAYWGHSTHWNFLGEKPEEAKSLMSISDGPRPVVKLVPTGARLGVELPLEGQRAFVEFDSAASVEQSGIDVAPVWTKAVTEQTTAAGEVQFDPSRVARLSARAGGVTRRVLKSVGDPVREGEVVALVEAAEVGRAKAEFQQALVQGRYRERLRDDLVAAKSASSPAAIRESEASVKEADVRLQAAAQALTNLGLLVRMAEYRSLTPTEAVRRMSLLGSEDVSTGLNLENATANLLPIRAPFAGVVLTTDVVTGEVVEAGKTLFVVVDPSRVVISLHVAPEPARRVTTGQKVLFRPDGGTREHLAAVAAVGTAADETTRTVPVRAEAENATGALRAATLGRGRIVFREELKALVVAHGAVHPFRGRSVVFVRDPEFFKPNGLKAFHVRVVQTGGRDDRNVEILAGVSPGEIVASKGSGELLGELTRATADR